MQQKPTLYLILLAIMFVACGNGGQSPQSQGKQVSSKGAMNTTTSYAYDQPDQVLVLSSQLNEISSLAYDAATDQLITNDDESGNYYVLNKSDGNIVQKQNFSKPDDYEGIEMVDSTIIVLKNTGTLFMYDLTKKSLERKNNALKGSNDVEGLCYDSDKQLLLLACKGKPLLKKKGKKDGKCIYTYDLQTESLDTMPYIRILEADLVNFVEDRLTHNSPAVKNHKFKRVREFAPSGIAIHPQTKDIYIISARGSLIVRTSPQGLIDEIGFFNEDTLPQPEGITFDNSGNLFIAGEGRGRSGKIFRFSLP